MEIIKKIAANITAVLSVFILTLSIIDLVNQAINMLDNTGARVILIVYCVFSLLTAILYISDMLGQRFREYKKIRKAEEVEDNDSL